MPYKRVVRLENLEDFEEDRVRRRKSQFVEDYVRNGMYTREAILDRFVSFFEERAALGDYIFEASNKHIFQPIVESLQATSDSEIDKVRFLELVTTALVQYHDRDIEIARSAELLYLAMKKLAFFPFEPLTTDKLDLNGIFRALWLTSFNFSPGLLSDGVLGIKQPGSGLLRGAFYSRERTQSDWKRMYFRAVARPKRSIAKVKESDVAFRSVSVRQFMYDGSDHTAGFLSAQWSESYNCNDIQSLEDERQVDLLDSAKFLCPDESIGIERFMISGSPPRICYRSVLEQDLPTYKLYLDQLMIPAKDFREFVKLFIILKAKPADDPLSIVKFNEVFVNWLPDDPEISWEIFDEVLTLTLVCLCSTARHC
jgi:hypothetical protein